MTNMKMIFKFKIGAGKMRDEYTTRQQTAVLDYMKANDKALSAEEVFLGVGSVGRTTVYRSLDRLAEKGCVIKVPSYEGKSARYRFIGKDCNTSQAKMVCLSCGCTIPLECGNLKELVNHIAEDHGFEIDTRHTMLYGYCGKCRKETDK